MGPADPLPPDCTRILIAGTAGAGKTTLGDQLAEKLSLPRYEMDNLHWGPGWTTRPDFHADVADMAASDAWVTEWQYREARQTLAQRAQVLIWLDYSAARRMYWVTRRTVMRRLRQQPIWESGLHEKPLHTVFTQEEHIIRWAWRTRRSLDQLPQVAEQNFPHVVIYRFGSPAQTQRWLQTAAS